MPPNPNHPPKGSSIKVEPIRSKRGIENLKKILADKPRDARLFTLGINTAYRANELLSVRVGQVRHVEVGDVLNLKQSKTRKYRAASLNRTVVAALRAYLEQDDRMRQAGDGDFLFYSQKGEVLTVPTLSRMVKGWCRDVGLKGNYGSHSLRKTWGYWQYQRGHRSPCSWWRSDTRHNNKLLPT